MTPEQQSATESFASSIAQLLAILHVVDFKMNLIQQHVSIDMDGEKMNIDLLKLAQHEIEKITLYSKN